MKISDALSDVTRICIDTAPFIYLVEEHPSYIEGVQTIFTFIDSGILAGFTSVITLTEVLTQPIKKRNPIVEQKYRDILVSSANIFLIPVNTTIASLAAHLRAQHNLRTPDALQIATAIDAGCDAFLTNDLGLKRISEVRVLVLDELELDREHK